MEGKQLIMCDMQDYCYLFAAKNIGLSLETRSLLSYERLFHNQQQFTQFTRITPN